MSPPRQSVRWRSLLLDTGLLLDLPDPLPAPLQPLALLRDQLYALIDLEERISLLRQPNPFHTGGVPRGIWFSMAGTIAFMAIGYGWLVAICGGAVVLGGVIRAPSAPPSPRQVRQRRRQQSQFWMVPMRCAGSGPRRLRLVTQRWSGQSSAAGMGGSVLGTPPLAPG